MSAHCTVRNCTWYVTHEHVNVAPTHRVKWYGGGWENVTVLEDKTHTGYGFRYGTMDVIGNDGVRRYIHFGLTNATDIKPIN